MVKKVKQVIIPPTAQITTNRVLNNISINDDSLTVEFSFVNMDGEEYSLIHGSSERITIVGDAYLELMLEKPSWNNNKDEGYWDERDLWYIIEAIEAGTLESSRPQLVITDPQPMLT